MGFFTLNHQRTSLTNSRIWFVLFDLVLSFNFNKMAIIDIVKYQAQEDEFVWKFPALRSVL